MLIDLPKPQGDNHAGITSILYYQLASNIAAFPPAGITTPTLSVLSGDIVLASGQVWKTLYCTIEAGALQSEMVGERDGRSFRNTLTVSHPGNSPSLLGFLEYIKNSGLVFVSRELDGQYRVVGSKFLPATVKAVTAGTGDAIDSKKAAVIEIEGIGRIAPVYNGALPTTINYGTYVLPGYVAPGYTV